MNEDVLKSIKRAIDGFRADILRNDYDIKSILTCILSYLSEQIEYDLERKKTTNSYS